MITRLISVTVGSVFALTVHTQRVETPFPCFPAGEVEIFCNRDSEAAQMSLLA